MTEFALRPRTATEIIDLAVRLLRRHFGAFYTVALVGLVPNLLVQVALLSTTTGDPTLAVSRFSWGATIAMPISLVFGSLMVGALLVLADEALRAGTTDVRLALSRAATRLGVIIGVSLLASLAAGIGILLLVIPGVYIGIRLATALPAAVVEGEGVIDALQRSWARTEGHALHVLKTFLLLLLLLFVLFIGVSIIGGVGAAVLGGAAGGARGGPGGIRAVMLGVQVFTTLVTAALYPVFTNTILVLSYDLRVRREGYDVEAMADALGAVP